MIAQNPKVSVVIPVHNEAGTLNALVGELQTHLTGLVGDNWEIVVVDDASTDPVVFPDRMRADDRFVLRRLPQRRGSGHVRRLGSAEAKGDWIAWIDGDGTYLAKDLCRLLAQLAEADQVIGARTDDHGPWRFLRLAVKGATCRVASWLWRARIPDLNSGLRVFRRESLMAFLQEVPDGFSCVTTATLAAMNRGQKVAFVPIAYRPRPVGSKSKFHPLWDTLRLWRVIHRQWRLQPARPAKR